MRIGKYYRLFRHPLFSIDQGYNLEAPERVLFWPMTFYLGQPLDPGYQLCYDADIQRGSNKGIRWFVKLYVLGLQIGTAFIVWSPVGDREIANRITIDLVDHFSNVSTFTYEVYRGTGFFGTVGNTHTGTLVLPGTSPPWGTTLQFKLDADTNYSRIPPYFP
jgi:hypothetical protein